MATRVMTTGQFTKNAVGRNGPYVSKSYFCVVLDEPHKGLKLLAFKSHLAEGKLEEGVLELTEVSGDVLNHKIYYLSKRALEKYRGETLIERSLAYEEREHTTRENADELFEDPRPFQEPGVSPANSIANTSPAAADPAISQEIAAIKATVMDLRRQVFVTHKKLDSVLDIVKGLFQS